MNSTLTLLTALLLAASASNESAVAATLTVDATGRAGFKSIGAAIEKANKGDTILVKPGTYRETIRPNSDVTLISEKGPVLTSIFVERGGRGVFVDHATNVSVEGFNIYSVLGAGKPTDGLVNIQNSTNVTMRNCYIHDAPNDADCVKVSDTCRLLLEACCIWNPGRRGGKESFQEGMDTRVRDFEITVRGCWFFHTDQGGDTLLYCKGGCFDILWENNIFGPSAGQGHANVPVQSGHQNAGAWLDYTPPYPSGRFVVRNNLFVGLKGEAAFGFQGPDTALLYNNVFYRNETEPSLITITDNPGAAGGPALNLFCFNNIFAGHGSRVIYRQRKAPVSAANLKRSHNLYYQFGGGGDLRVQDETGSIIGKDPQFVAPAIPVFDFDKGPEQIRRVRDGFKLAALSPASGAGIDPLQSTGAVHPKAIPEMLKNLEAVPGVRQPPGKRDMGLHAFSNANSRIP
ncbi:MAG: right-handed parallel beta-helix repeat-containing protein [Verrucomicrobiota bacterium]